LGNPWISYDTNLIIKPETVYTQTNTGISHNTTLTFDNTHNLERYMDMTLTLSSPLSSLTISSITGGYVINIAPSAGIVSGEVLNVFYDSVYRTSGTIAVELSNTVFSCGLFKLEEDYSNELRFTMSPTSGIINGVFGWVKPSVVSHSIGFAEGFGYNETRELNSKKNNINNQYVDKYYTNNITNDFNIDRLTFEDYFIDNDPDQTYQIEFSTDSEVSDIEQSAVFLCGVKFSSLGWNYTEGDMVKEGIRGNFVKKLVD
jgi:hypothetical protein